MTKRIRHASVCTGLGAAELAAKLLGWENVFMSEIEEFCRTILKYHFPNTKLYGDFTKEDFRQYRGLIDVFTAGFPCQPFSVSGNRLGAADHRYLWPEVFRLIKEFMPAWFIGENVAGITSMVFPGNEVEVESQSGLFEADYKETILEERYILESICQDLESIGYSVRTFIVPACAVGAPHRRDRVWIVANRANTGLENLQRKRKDGVYQFETTAYAKSVLPQGRKKRQDEIKPWRSNRGHLQQGWAGFPTQSPVCGRNDGLSYLLDGITFSKWRSKSIEAYGNAIVPQALCQFFKIIDEIENQNDIKQNKRKYEKL